MVKFLILFLFFLNNAFCNSVVVTTNNTQISTTQTTDNKIEDTKQNVIDNIKNNLVDKELANNDIFLNPINDEYYKDFKSFMLGDSVIGIIRKALDINSSVWVSASAGSGKIFT